MREGTSPHQKPVAHWESGQGNLGVSDWNWTRCLELLRFQYQGVGWSSNNRTFCNLPIEQTFYERREGETKKEEEGDEERDSLKHKKFEKTA